MKNSKINSNQFYSNPLVITIIAIISLIIILAIFKSSSQYFGVGFGINAHIGDLKANLQIETFDNEESSEEININSESNDYTSSQPAFVMYYTNWCGHCKTTKPEFKKLMDSYEGLVNIMMVNCESDKNKDLVKSQNIRGYPTIRYYPNGLKANYLEYTDDRIYNSFVNYLKTQTANSFENYIDSNMNQNNNDNSNMTQFNNDNSNMDQINNDNSNMDQNDYYNKKRNTPPLNNLTNKSISALMFDGINI